MKWSYYILNKLGTQVVAVTGTSGKSVTVEAISHVLQTRFPVHKSVGDMTGRMSLPLTLAKLTPETKWSCWNWARRSRAKCPRWCCRCSRNRHCDADRLHRPLRDGGSTAQEDRLLVEYLPTTGLAVLNYDDDRTRAMAAHTRAKALTVGLEGFGAT